MSDDTQQQINQLRTQVETLMRDRVTPAVSNVAERAQVAATRMREQTDSVAEQIRDQPLVSMAIAAAIGFILGRALIK